MPSLPHIGPLSTPRAMLDRVREVVRGHLPWVSALILLMGVGLLLKPSVYFLGVSLQVWSAVITCLVVGANAGLFIADRLWPQATVLGPYGLTVFNEWIVDRDEWIEPVARWVAACGELDMRHFLCVRRQIEGPRAPPLGLATGQWALRCRLSQGSVCTTPCGLAEGRVRQMLVDMQNQKAHDQISKATPPAAAKLSRPRRL